MKKTDYLITVLRCEESGMLVGQSTDIPGLTIEGSTPHDIVEAIVEVVPRLLMHNLNLSPEEVTDCSINVQCKMAPARAQRMPPRPHIFVDTELVGVAA